MGYGKEIHKLKKIAGVVDKTKGYCITEKISRINVDPVMLLLYHYSDCWVLSKN